jgi:hypothetical protein
LALDRAAFVPDLACGKLALVSKETRGSLRRTAYTGPLPVNGSANTSREWH